MNENRSRFNDYLIAQLTEKVNILGLTLYQMAPLHDVFNVHAEKPIFSPFQFEQLKGKAFMKKPKECCQCARGIDLSDPKKCEYFTVCTKNKFCYQEICIVK